MKALQALRDKPLLIWALLLVMGGCAQNTSATRDFQYMPERGSGVIVGSVTEVYQSGPQYAYGGNSTSSYFYLADLKGKSISLTSGARPKLFVRESDNEFPGIGGLRGQAFAVELPPGEYSLTHWSMQFGGYTATGTRKRPVKFIVEAGKIHYLGNLVIQLLYKDDPDGYIYVAGAQVASFDQLSRDLPVITEKFPTLQGRDIQSQIVDLSAWKEPVPATWRQAPIYIPLSIR